MALLTRKKTMSVSAPAGHDLMDAPLMHLNRYDSWTLGNACEGTLILGGTGSGKTSGSGNAISRAMLRAGFGGLVLCAKPDEAERWQRLCAEAGRSDDLVIINPDSALYFNFLSYEWITGGHEPMNVVHLLMRLAQGEEKGGDSKFWYDAAEKMLKSAVAILAAATGQVKLADIMRLILSAPLTRKEAEDDTWIATSFCFSMVDKAKNEPSGTPLSPHDGEIFGRYWMESFPAIADKMRSGIIATLDTVIDPFLTGNMHEMFCTATNIVPDYSFMGKILVMDMPIKQYGKAGSLAQSVMKYCWQKAVERRNVRDYPRPVFLFADECQFFMSDYDNEFQSTARSSRACTVYMTQNLPTVYSHMSGGGSDHSAAHALLGNFQTKIFHQNTDHITNQWAADIIGKRLHQRGNSSSSQSNSTSMQLGRNQSTTKGNSWSTNYTMNAGYSSNSSDNRGSQQGWNTSDGRSVSDSHSHGYSEQMDYELQPVAFTTLGKGGKQSNYLADAIIVQGGRLWYDTRRSWTLCRFNQLTKA